MLDEWMDGLGMTIETRMGIIDTIQSGLRRFALNKPNVYAVCAHDGKQYNNGTTFIAQNAFRMRCLTFENLTSTFEIVSCITPAGIEIPMGVKIEEGDRVFECTPGNITLKSTPGKTGKCRGVYDVGQTWVEESFKLRCEPYGKVTLTSCITKENVEIPLGESRRVPAGFVMECATIDGNVALRAAKNAQCNASNGEEKQIGQSWHDGNFVRRCSEYGIANISGCFVDDIEIGLNQNYTSGNLVHMCIHNGDQYSFRTISKAATTVLTTIKPQSA